MPSALGGVGYRVEIVVLGRQMPIAGGGSARTELLG
jgi:hypothetical protein